MNNKSKLIVWDVSVGTEDWLNSNLLTDNAEISEYIIEQEGSELVIDDIRNMSGWDYLLIFVDPGIQNVTDDMLDKLGISREVRIYPNSSENLLKNQDVCRRLFKIAVMRNALYPILKENNEYVTCTVDGLSYIGRSSDIMIMRSMYVLQENWAKTEMHRFFELAAKFNHAMPKIDDSDRYFFDIGANIGTTSIYVKKKLDEGLKLVCFEPMPDIYRMLSMNMMLNQIPENEYTLNQVGLSDADSTADMYYCPENPGASSLMNIDDDEERTNVKTVRFDTFMENAGIDPKQIAYMWIDIEGFEGEFMSGGQKALAEIDAPTVMEFTPKYLVYSGKFDMFMENISKIWKYYIVMQEDDTIYPIESLREKDMKQVDLYLMKDKG